MFPIAVLGQDDSGEARKAPETSIGKLADTKGALFVKDFYDIGCIDKWDQKIKIEALFVYRHDNKDKKERGLRIEIDEPMLKYSNSTFLDMDEVENLVAAIVNMQKIITDWKTKTRKAYTEVTFSSRDNFSLGFYQTPQNMDNRDKRSFMDRLRSKNMNIEGDKNLIMTVGYQKKAHFVSDLSELAEFKRLIEKGLAVLNVDSE